MLSEDVEGSQDWEEAHRVRVLVRAVASFLVMQTKGNCRMAYMIVRAVRADKEDFRPAKKQYAVCIVMHVKTWVGQVQVHWQTICDGVGLPVSAVA